MKPFFLFIAGMAFCTNIQAQTTVVIDAGHGGKDKGYVTKDGIAESTLTFQFAQALGKELAKHNVKVEYASNEGEYTDLATRAQKAKDTKNAYFISIHMESDENPAAHGQTVIIDRDNENKLSDDFANVLMTIMKPFGEIKLIKKGMVILKSNTVPSVVYSPGYMSNAEDLKLLQSPAFQQRVAIVLANMLSGR